MNLKLRLCGFILLYVNITLCNSEAYHRYMWAHYTHLSGNTKQAHSWYTALFSSPYSLYSYKGYILLLFDTHQYNSIVDLIPTIDQKFENDSEIQLILALALEKCKKTAEADARIIKLTSAFKTNADVTLRAAQIYVRRKEPENALLTIDNFLNNSPRKTNNFVFYFLKSQIHLQLNQLPQALENITLCIDIHPRFDKGWLLFATLHEQKGEIKKALQGYTTFLELSEHNPTIEQHLYSLLVRHKNEQHYIPFHKTYFDLASSYFNHQKYQLSLYYLNKYLILQPDNQDALMLKVQLLALLGEDKKIIEFITTHKDTSCNFPAHLWPKILYLLQNTGIKKERIINLLQETGKKDNNNPWFNLYAADLCIKEHKTADALSLLKNTLSLSLDDSLKAKIYHQMGIISYEMNNYQDMIDYLEKGYAINTHNDHLNNSLAYYWTTKGKNIEKAQLFFNQITDQAKTHPAIRDTQALILYKQEKYTDAQKILEPLSKKPHNPTIIRHLAKTYYKLHNPEKAAELYRTTISYAMTDHEKRKWEKLHERLHHE